MPEILTSIGEGAFEDCTSLTGIAIPDGVKELRKKTFYGCTLLADVTLSSSLTSIGETAFYDCKSLTDITIPNSVVSIGQWAFSGCMSLAEATLSSSLTAINDGTFYGCLSLTDITVPDAVVTIGEDAFNDCLNLMSIYCYCPTPPRVGSSAFTIENFRYVTLYVPEGSLETYKSASIWKGFANIQEFDPTGISGVEATEDMDVSVEGGSIVVSGAQGSVAVYSLSGAMVGRAKGGSRTVVAVPGPGVYVVKAGGKAVKVRINNE